MPFFQSQALIIHAFISLMQGAMFPEVSKAWCGFVMMGN